MILWPKPSQVRRSLLQVIPPSRIHLLLEVIEDLRRGGAMRRRCYPTASSLPIGRFRNPLANVHAEFSSGAFVRAK
jgi:hypothetical protein